MRNTTVDVVVSVADKAKFRVLPRNGFDELGRVKPFKPDPKDPDRRLGGVKGEFKDVQKGLWVAASLYRNRTGKRYLANMVIVLGQEETDSTARTPR